MEDRKGAMYAAEDKLHTILSQSFQVMIDESNAAKKAAAKTQIPVEPITTKPQPASALILEFKSPVEIMSAIIMLSGLTAIAVTAAVLLLVI
jgi:hypothetical protein